MPALKRFSIYERMTRDLKASLPRMNAGASTLDID
jgi:hypothetical protein